MYNVQFIIAIQVISENKLTEHYSVKIRTFKCLLCILYKELVKVRVPFKRLHETLRVG